jgi:hypothetical protein
MRAGDALRAGGTRGAGCRVSGAGARVPIVRTAPPAADLAPPILPGTPGGRAFLAEIGQKSVLVIVPDSYVLM